jgi:Ring finger domain
MTRKRRSRGSRSAVHAASRRRTNPSSNGSEQVVDLTCDSAHDYDLFVDLTSADTSVIVVPDTPATPVSAVDSQMYSSSPLAAAASSPLVLTDSGDSDADLPALPFDVSRRTQPAAAASALPSVQTAVISCPICLDSLNEIKDGERHIMATKCGHVFCSSCMQGILRDKDMGSRCPTCRKKLSANTVHQLFI